MNDGRAQANKLTPPAYQVQPAQNSSPSIGEQSAAPIASTTQFSQQYPNGNPQYNQGNPLLFYQQQQLQQQQHPQQFQTSKNPQFSQLPLPQSHIHYPPYPHPYVQHTGMGNNSSLPVGITPQAPIPPVAQQAPPGVFPTFPGQAPEPGYMYPSPQRLAHIPIHSPTPVVTSKKKTKSVKSSKSPSSSSEDAESKKKRKRLSISCTTCRKRKIKCDRQRPICGSCQKNNVPVHLCIYDDSPWVSSLVKEQTLQNEIEALVEQRQKLKKVVGEKDEKLASLTDEYEKLLKDSKNNSNSNSKSLSINSLMNSEAKLEEQLVLDFKKLLTFTEDEYNGIFSLQNFVKLTPAMSDVVLSQKKRNLIRRYQGCTIDDLAHNLPPFKVFEEKFQYLFDINFNPEFNLMSILKDKALIQSIFQKNFNKKSKINFNHTNPLELCYCLLILKFGMVFNHDEETSKSIEIYSVCYEILIDNIEKVKPSLFLLENLMLLNNMVNVISFNHKDTNLMIPQMISSVVNRLSLQYTNQDKNLWFTLLYQDYFISLTNGTPLSITSLTTSFAVDDENFDDVAWCAILMLRDIYTNFISPQNVSDLVSLEWKITTFYEEHIAKFDPKFYLNFNIRTSKTGADKDKRFVMSLLCLDLFVNIKCIKFLNNGDKSLVQFIILAVIFVQWITDQILTEESCSKNRCLQIVLAPILKNLFLKVVVIASGLEDNVKDRQIVNSEVNLWAYPLHEAEKFVLKNKNSATTLFDSRQFFDAVSLAHSNLKQIDLFNGDESFMTDLETALQVLSHSNTEMQSKDIT